MRAIGAPLGAVLLTAVWAAPTSAHVALMTSLPEAGTNLTIPPSEVSITFDDELDPDLSSFTVSGPGSTEVGGGEVDLTVADRNVMTGTVTITTPGVYTVTYKVAGVDGHGLEGSFSFGYQATTAIPDPTSDEGPDTAMREPPTPTSLLLLGALFLLASATIALRRLGRS